MKRLNYILYLLLAMFFVVACEDDDPVKTKEEEEVVDYGDVEAMFEAKLLTGELVETIDMGKTLTISDISKGRPDKREWTITSSDGSVVIDTDDEKVQTFFFPVGDMDYDVKLSVERTSDGQTDELLEEGYIRVRKIDVTADFTTNGPVDDLPESEGGGDYTVGRGLPITFLNTSEGAPDELSWEFENGTPLTSDAKNVDVVFNRDGLFTATLTATRTSDGSSHEVTKLIRVIQEYMDVQEATVDNRTITLKYNQPVMEDPSAAKDDLTVEIITASGAAINAGVESITSSDSTFTLTLDQDTYHDDVVTLSYDGITGNLKSTDPAYIARTMNKLHAVEVGNMFFKGEYDGGYETWIDKATNIQPQGGRSNFNFEVSENNPLSGDKSGYFEIGENGDNYGDILQKVSEYHSIEPGKEYQVGIWLYVEEMADPSINVATYWRFGPMSGGWWLGDNRYDVGTVDNSQIGKWVYVTGTIGTGLLNGESGHFMWRIGNHCKFYMDNMKMYPSSSFRARPGN